MRRRGRRAAGRSAGAWSRPSGQTLVEFALVLPLFLLLLFAVIDGGRLVYENSVVSQAAREGARLAAVEAGWIGSSDPACGTVNGPVCPAGVATGTPSLKGDVLAAANRMTTPFGRVADAHLFISCTAQGGGPSGAWTGVSCASPTAGSIVSVRVEMPWSPLTPIVGQILGSVWLTGSATMTIN